ncbi:hypothetical protein EV643_11749 [Kribbella sp. VKM Ac-2527]|uniref:Uncharacterized protein n=1 Tax=Kribbella caucasensis TaxID=2512215 RepID=A0A4R6K7W7_9ACTN|nr:hypothetical protein [Kribbella sp. VKM Ac-2527]TDO44026.1 hypothetical protein EV643_11749 [Kribbella sp. VKM Ac-2527]
MSELKELSWSVQEKVEPVPFEQLERRGIRRRRRKQALAGVGVAAATTGGGLRPGTGAQVGPARTVRCSGGTVCG